MPKEVMSYQCIHCSKLFAAPVDATFCEHSHVVLVGVTNGVYIKILCGPHQGMYSKDKQETTAVASKRTKEDQE